MTRAGRGDRAAFLEGQCRGPDRQQAEIGI
jgi:hypothetical protein